MPKKELIKELKRLLRQRGEVTETQREYALVEERSMMQRYPLTKPHEEKRFSHLRTLQSYIGEHAVRMMNQNEECMESIHQSLVYD